jgi:hypothetical protein
VAIDHEITSVRHPLDKLGDNGIVDAREVDHLAAFGDLQAPGDAQPGHCVAFQHLVQAV